MMSHDYHSTQCAGCVFGIWRGGCSHPRVTPEDTEAAVLDDCPLHAAGHPRPHELNGGVCAVVTVASLHAAEVRASDAEAERDALRARAEAAEALVAALQAEAEAGVALVVARAEAAEATAARLNAANVRLMRRLAPTLSALVASTDELAKMGQRAVAAEDALAAARAETGRLRAAIRAAARALPEWSKGALEHLSPAELVADDVRMALRQALLPPVESA
jgi:hypothetical protein